MVSSEFQHVFNYLCIFIYSCAVYKLTSLQSFSLKILAILIHLICHFVLQIKGLSTISL